MAYRRGAAEGIRLEELPHSRLALQATCDEGLVAAATRCRRANIEETLCGKAQSLAMQLLEARALEVVSHLQSPKPGVPQPYGTSIAGLVSRYDTPTRAAVAVAAADTSRTHHRDVVRVVAGDLAEAAKGKEQVLKAVTRALLPPGRTGTAMTATATREAAARHQRHNVRRCFPLSLHTSVSARARRAAACVLRTAGSKLSGTNQSATSPTAQ
eukprot:scaffold539_cov359-Prasinococcus_capsulatus_cf.AAC.33